MNTDTPTHELVTEASEWKMDWRQVVLNGGPPCFAKLPDDIPNRFCGRAERWDGHHFPDPHHTFVPLEQYVASFAAQVSARERDAAVKAERERIAVRMLEIGFTTFSWKEFSEKFLREFVAEIAPTEGEK
jgi:hypothetical protein